MARLKRWTTGRAIAVAAVLLIVLAFAFSMPYRLRALPGGALPVQRVEQVTATVNGERQQLTLPYTFRNLPPETPVAITFPVESRGPFSVLVKTVYAPDEVAFNGETVSTYGEEGTYPSFFDDPPTTVRVYNFRPDMDGNGKNTVTVTYHFPHDRAQLPVAPFAISNISGIFRYEFMGLMACFFLEAFLALTGLALVLLSLSVYRLEKGRRMLQQLGLFFLAVGVWNIGENDFSVFVIQNPVLLYMMAFTGLFFVIAPLYGFALNAVPFRWRRLLTTVFYASAALPALALLLQLAGLVMMMQSLFFFHVFHPAALLLLTAALIHEAVREENRRARWMLVPVAVLLVSAVVEVLNYYAFHSFEFSLIFLFGSFIFLLLMLVLAGVFLHKDAQMRQAYERQQHESELMAVRLSAEKKRHDMMMREERRLAKLRHDLKHHVALLTSFIADGDPGRAQDYLAELSENIRRKTSAPCCENVAVSAVIEHYAALARQDGIGVVIDTDVPEKIGGLSDTELASVFGNLLENALEACRRGNGEKASFIQLKARILDQRLVILMENSLFEQSRPNGEFYHSSKRGGQHGIGLRSIADIAEAHGGTARFEADGDAFRSSVILELSAQ